MSMYAPGENLEPLVLPAITKDLLKAYAEASGDPNVIHLNDEAARAVGLPGVIAHGMLTMAFFGQFASLRCPQNMVLDELSCRFKAMTFPGDVVTVTAKVKLVEAKRIVCSVEARNQKDEVTANGAISYIDR